MSTRPEFRERTSLDNYVEDEAVAFLASDHKYRRNQHHHHHRRRRNVVLNSLLLIFILILALPPLSIITYDRLGRPLHSPIDPTTTLLHGTSLIPSFPFTKTMTVAPNPSFYGSSAPEAWQSTHIPGGGFVTFGNHTETLGPPIRYNDRLGYGISAFHQLHCIESVHVAFLQLKGVLNASTAVHSHKHSSEVQQGGTELWHIEHCFDYLRQVVMCHADLALEHRQEWEGAGPDSDATDGWDVVHQCRDWDAVVAFAVNHRLTDAETQRLRHPEGSSVG